MISQKISELIFFLKDISWFIHDSEKFSIYESSTHAYESRPSDWPRKISQGV